MMLTTSKHAGIGLKRLAAKLADALPGGRLVRRGEQGLERIEELAGRDAEEVVLVLSEMQGKDEEKNRPHPAFILRSRQLGKEADGTARWAWQEQEMVVQRMECPEVIGAEEKDEPYSVSAQGAEAKTIASFLGMKESALAKYYDDAKKVEVEVEKKKAEADKNEDKFIVSIDGKQILSIKYRWQALCAK